MTTFNINVKAEDSIETRKKLQAAVRFCVTNFYHFTEFEVCCWVVDAESYRVDEGGEEYSQLTSFLRGYAHGLGLNVREIREERRTTSSSSLAHQISSVESGVVR